MFWSYQTKVLICNCNNCTWIILLVKIVHNNGMNCKLLIFKEYYNWNHIPSRLATKLKYWIDIIKINWIHGLSDETKLVKFNILFVMELLNSHLFFELSLSLDVIISIYTAMDLGVIDSDRLLINLFFHGEGECTYKR